MQEWLVAQSEVAIRWRPSAIALVVGALVLLTLMPGVVAASSAGGSGRVRPVGRLHLADRRGGAVMTSSLIDPEGQRMQSGPETDAINSSNWSGLAGTGTGILGVEGHWTVPAVASAATARYSSSWVGIDGLNPGDTDLIQTGTEQDTTGGYYAWWEILPKVAVRIVTSRGQPAVVKPGDRITALVQKQAATGKWTIYIRDITRTWYFEEDFAYPGPGASAEWIEEAPTMNLAQTALANFGAVHFSGTAVFGRFGASPGWYSTDLNATNEIVMRNSSNTRTIATPSAPTPASAYGQQFSDVYVTAPRPPARLRAVARRRSVHLSWRAPTRTGGTPIVGYEVRKFRGGVLRQTVFVKATSITMGRLIPGARYSFSVAARSAGNYTSPYTARSAIRRPRQ